MAETKQRIWQDRKRHLGLPLSFTQYALSQDRLFVSTGLLTRQDEELLLYRVKDISTSRTLWQRMLGLGSITVLSSDKTAPTLILQNVKDPLAVKELLFDNVEQAKLRRRVRMTEIVAAQALPDEEDDDLDDEL